MTKLSVNVNKIATLRNSRGSNNPDLESVAASIIRFGSDGITIHPRPDERHIKYSDIFPISNLTKDKVEFNIEGFPSEKFLKKAMEIKPDQVTLVPDKPDTLTSLEGWDTIQNRDMLQKIIQDLHSSDIRVAIFIHPNLDMLKGAFEINADRIELFTGIYATNKQTIDSYIDCSEYAHSLGMGVNAGHDLDLNNLPFFISKMPYLDEVSIGHALISESLFLGLEKTIKMYKEILA